MLHLKDLPPDLHPDKLIFSIPFSACQLFMLVFSLNELFILITLHLTLIRCLNCDIISFFKGTCKSGISVGIERIKMVFLTAEMINTRLLRGHFCVHSVGIIIFAEMTQHSIRTAETVNSLLPNF